jgi:hypothetical protein
LNPGRNRLNANTFSVKGDQKMRKLFFTGLILLFSASAFAENIFLAPWEEDPTNPYWLSGATTLQIWEASAGVHVTSTGQLLHQPVLLENPFGPAWVEYSNGQQATAPGWERDAQGNRIPIQTVHIGDYDDNTADLGGIDIFISNDPTERFEKLVHIQITSDKSYTIDSPTSSPGGSWQAGGVVQWDGTAWYTYEGILTIRPNPNFEVIHFDFPGCTDISEIVVKTICVPEPSACVLFASGLGIFGLILRRKRRG